MSAGTAVGTLPSVDGPAGHEILAQKVVRPPPTAAAPARLIDRVEQTPDGGVCVVTSAPGYGKTTLLGQATAGSRTAWLRLDDRDSDPLRLWNHLVHAVVTGAHVAAPAGHRPGLIADMPRQARAGRPPPNGVDADAVLAALEDVAPDWVVLDGVDRDVHAAALGDLRYLLQYLPPGVRLAVAARRDVGSCLADVRARGQLLEIDEHHLALTAQEAGAVVHDPAAGEELAALTGGWPVALTAAARQRGTDPDTDLIRWLALSWAPAVFRPWLESLPPEQSRLLHETNVLDLLHPDLCDVVRGSDDSAPVLDSLVRDHRHVLAVEQDGERWLARTPLLTAVLRDPPGAAAAHRRAAAWFAERGAVEPQVKHLIAAGDSHQAQTLVRAMEDEALAAGRGPVLREWYRALPPEALGGTGDALLRLAWSHVVSGDTTPAFAVLRRLEPLVDPVALLGATTGGGRTATVPATGQLGPRRLAAETAFLSGWLHAQDGDLQTALARTRRAVELRDGAWSSNGDQLAQVHLGAVLLWLGQPAAARAVMDPLTGRPFTSAMVGEILFPTVAAELALREGRLYEANVALAVARRCLDRGEPVREHTYERVVAPLVAVLRAERGELREAADELDTPGMQQVATEANLLRTVRVHLARAHVMHVAGEAAAALRHLAAARRAVVEQAPEGGLLPMVDVVEARVRLAAGDVLRAERLIRRLPAGEERAILRARCAVVRSPTGALSRIEACEVSTPRLLVERHVLLAAARVGATRRAEEHLLAAADIARATGLVLALLDAPPQVLALAARTASREGHDDLARLVDSAGRPWRPPAERRDVAPGQALSRGDLALLALLPGRQSNIQLAEELSVSVNTVKTRLKRLYARLGAHDRDDAVENARRLGLLP